MASTQTGAALTEAFRLAGINLAAATIRDLATLWGAFDLDDIDESWRRVSVGLIPLLAERHRISADAGAAYYTSFRAIEATKGRPTIQLAEFDRKQAEANLALLGPIYTKKAIAANRPRPKATAFTRVAGEVTRQVLSGGRQTVARSVLADPQALGWARATDGNPCAFCAMLAGRGAVYRSDSGGFQAHTHCGCTAEPVYNRRANRPGRGAEFSQLWSESTSGLRGEEARRAFRRAYEGRA